MLGIRQKSFQLLRSGKEAMARWRREVAHSLHRPIILAIGLIELDARPDALPKGHGPEEAHDALIAKLCAHALADAESRRTSGGCFRLYDSRLHDLCRCRGSWRG